jgi:hypothetical protein
MNWNVNYLKVEYLTPISYPSMIVPRDRCELNSGNSPGDRQQGFSLEAADSLQFLYYSLANAL